MIKNFIIAEVLNKNTNKRDEDFGYRVGRECSIDLLFINIGNSLTVYYPNNKYFITSKIDKIEEDKYGFTITTQNRIYRFNYKNNC